MTNYASINDNSVTLRQTHTQAKVLIRLCNFKDISNIERTKKPTDISRAARMSAHLLSIPAMQISLCYPF